MFEEYLGKKMSKQKIFNTFIGFAVTGQPDTSEYPKVYITKNFIGTDDGSMSNECIVLKQTVQVRLPNTIQRVHIRYMVR